MVNTQRKYWLLDNKQNKIYTEEYYEGSLQQALVNRYERNPIARKNVLKTRMYMSSLWNGFWQSVWRLR